MESTMRVVILPVILVLSGCGGSFPDCTGRWEGLDEQRMPFLQSDRSETTAAAMFGTPTVTTANTWRWDIYEGDDFCGKWWVTFSPTIAIGREEAHPCASCLP
jgi:hypothetical protein